MLFFLAELIEFTHQMSLISIRKFYQRLQCLTIKISGRFEVIRYHKRLLLTQMYLLVAFKGQLTSNYPAACLALGATVMSLSYQRIIQVGVMPCCSSNWRHRDLKDNSPKVCVSITGNSEARG